MSNVDWGSDRPWWHPVSLGWTLCFIVVSNAAGLIGLMLTQPPGAWYRSLAKPPGTPPGAVFGVVWPVLYTLVGIGVYLALRGRGGPGRPEVLGWFAGQWVLNAAWTPLFFGLRGPLWAGMDLLVLNLVVCVMLARYSRRSRWGAACLLPYQIWLVFALYINGGILFLNP